MSKSRALTLAVASFLLFAGLVVALFVVANVEKMFLLVGPIIIVAISCAGIYRRARSTRG